MNELDRKIQQALCAEDTELFKDFGGEQSILEMVADSFRGKHRWLVAITMFWSLAFFALAVISAFRFFGAEDTRMMLTWGLAFIFCMSAVSMLKMWYFMELNKNAVTREIKRLELQIARLAARLKD